MMLGVETELLRRVWFPVARVQDVVAGPQRGLLLDTELVIWRAPDGTVTVAQGMCPHRNAALADGEVAGDGSIACPYHGWRFTAAGGELAAIPSQPDDAPLPRCSLVTYPSRVAYGLVWTALDPEPYLPPLTIDGLPEDWQLARDGQLTYWRAGEWEIAWGEAAWVRCGMRALHENFADMSHFGFVHRASMGRVGARLPEYQVVAGDGWSLDYELHNLPDEAPAGAGSVAEIALARTNRYRMTLPSFTTIRSQGAGGGTRFVAQFVSPATTDGELVRNFWCAGIDAVMRERFGVDLVTSFAFDDRVTNEDYPILEASRPREQPLSARGQVHTRADASSIAYRRAYRSLLRRFAADTGRADPFADESTDGEPIAGSSTNESASVALPAAEPGSALRHGVPVDPQPGRGERTGHLSSVSKEHP